MTLDLLGEPPPVDLYAMIVEVRRELRLRRNLYPVWARDGRLNRHEADRRIAVMKAVLDKLEAEYKEEKKQ